MRRDHQSTELTRAHDAQGFEHWPLAAIYTLRAMGSVGGNQWMDTVEVQEASQVIGRTLSYPAARNGIRYLVNTWDAEESVRDLWSIQRLTPKGRQRAARSFALFPAERKDREISVIEKLPPDPVTPLWRILYDEGEVLVIAADRQAALALFESETGEDAHRAEPVDTTAPVVLTWTLR
jgi:hypothetical protein